MTKKLGKQELSSAKVMSELRREVARLRDENRALKAENFVLKRLDQSNVAQIRTINESISRR